MTERSPKLNPILALAIAAVGLAVAASAQGDPPEHVLVRNCVSNADALSSMDAAGKKRHETWSKKTPRHQFVEISMEPLNSLSSIPSPFTFTAFEGEAPFTLMLRESPLGGAVRSRRISGYVSGEEDGSLIALVRSNGGLMGLVRRVNGESYWLLPFRTSLAGQANGLKLHAVYELATGQATPDDFIVPPPASPGGGIGQSPAE